MNSLEKKINFKSANAQVIIKLISEIDTFKGKWSVLETMNENILGELREFATIQSIGSSTRIEGATLSDQDIKGLIAKLDITKFDTRDSQEVIGYYDALELIIVNFQDIQLSENYIKQLHSVLLKHSIKDNQQGGVYKKITNKVVATYPNGAQKTIFNTTELALVPSEMEKVITWTNDNFHKDEIHPLILIGLFVYEFLSIHPFHDGNGRLSRLLTTLLLLKHDYDFVKYISFEHQIEVRKKEYYSALMECQKNRNTDAEEIDKWIIFFLGSMKQMSIKLEHKLHDANRTKSIYLNDRQKQIVNFIKKNEVCKIGDIHKSFADKSINTLKKDMKYLVENGVIVRYGERKGSVYQVKD